jgi:hypothetical protein
MYTLFRSASAGALLATLPALMISFVIAELFFKWKSFALECLGFLALWFVLDVIFSAVRAVWLRRTGATPAGAP